jgi:hypothetical protein
MIFDRTYQRPKVKGKGRLYLNNLITVKGRNQISWPQRGRARACPGLEVTHNWMEHGAWLPGGLGVDH